MSWAMEQESVQCGVHDALPCSYSHIGTAAPCDLRLGEALQVAVSPGVDKRMGSGQDAVPTFTYVSRYQT
jgi:hypothetical protein